MSIADAVSEQILPRVRKPSRYLGCELNSVHKDPERVALRVCLAFPDSYDLGLGNLGLQILYHILNQREDVWCERVCAPHADLEAELTRRRLPLFSLESKTPLAEFDLLGFTLQWELNYTNIVNMLALGGVPPLAAERGDGHPLVIAGGPCVFNPEPLAIFIDAFVIGDGEEAVLEVVDAVRAGGGRARVLERLAGLPGVYVPALYPMISGPGGEVLPDPAAPPIVKRLVRDLDAQPFPTDYLVPYGEQVHDRVALEVLRGCTQSCRFCQAGMVTRPVRERSLETLARLQDETMRRTGYEELSLVSLSTCDYSQVRSLVSQSVELARPDHISVSLPSLRLDSFSVDLAHQVSSVRKSGLTFAPEAATDRLRAVINKFIGTEDLLEMARQCYGHGWDTLKLYFMIGLPTETDEDVAAIAELSNQVLAVGRGLRRRAKVNLGVSTFVPKPQTPFQWAEQIDSAETRRRQQLLWSALAKGVKFGRHNPFHTYLEGLLTRADRRAGWLLLYAWQEGARFDGWDEQGAASEAAWTRAIARWEADFAVRAADQLLAREVAAPLPWDHIDVMIPKGWLAADWERAQRLDWQADCRREKCHRCGVIEQETLACTSMLRRSREGARAEAELVPQPPPEWSEPPAVARVRMRWSRTGLVRLLSHIETLNVFIRALRRARVPMRYSEGYHPHAAVSFSAALPVGLETVADYLDVQVTEPVDANDVMRRLNSTLPEGFGILEAWCVEAHPKALMALLDAHRYEFRVPRELAAGLDDRIDAWLARDRVEVGRRAKQGERIIEKQVDIRPNIAELVVDREVGEHVILAAMFVPHESRQAKPAELLASLLSLAEDEQVRIVPRKVASYRYADGTLLRLERPEEVPV